MKYSNNDNHSNDELISGFGKDMPSTIEEAELRMIQLQHEYYELQYQNIMLSLELMELRSRS
jgi:hypothetical protein